MAKRGPKPKVSDERLLLELLARDSDATLAREIEPAIDLGLQQTRDRLNDLASETEYVSFRKVSNRNLYRLTEPGRDHLIDIMRESL